MNFRFVISLVLLQGFISNARSSNDELTKSFAAVFEAQKSSLGFAPDHSKVKQAKLIDKNLIITFEFPKNYLFDQFNKSVLEELSQLIDINLDQLTPDARYIHFNENHFQHIA